MKAKPRFVVALASLGVVAALFAPPHAAALACRPAPADAEVGVPLASAPAGALARARAASKGGGLRSADYDLGEQKTLSRVILLIRENYVEPDRIKPYDMFLAALDYIQRTQPEVMVDDAQAPARISVSAGGKSQIFDLGGLDQLWEVTMALRDIFRFLQVHVTDAEARRNIEYAAINGMLSTLDPHSILLRPESFDEVKLSTKGEFGGLGIVISLRDGALTVISPIEGTPANQVGLRAKDKIVKIGEESTVNMGLDEAVQRLRGRPDTQVTIGVQRKGWTEPKPFTLTRAIIKIESVSGQLLDDGVGYVKIKSFQGNTFDDLQAHLLRLRHDNKDRDLAGLVLDLRNNPGGLLDQAILVSDRFIERGPLVITVGEGNRRREVKNAHVGLDESTYPIVVLLNGGSASASEIVAGALKNHDRALVLGQQSFGKGSVQVLYDFKDRSALKLTIAQYLTPGDVSIQSVGIVPDVMVTPAVIEKEAIHLFVDDEAPREKDLEKHLEQHGQTKVTSNSIRLYHLDEKERAELAGDPAAMEAAHDEAIAAAERFSYDFETKLAHDILRQVKTLSRPKMIEQATTLLEARARDEDGVIAKRMGELGIDWQQGARAKGEARAEVQLTSSAPEGGIDAGGNLVLTGEVHNVGRVPLFRVYGTTQSDNPLLKNLEFAFGHLPPGERRSWSVRVKLPADMAARADEVSLRLGDLHNQSEAMVGRTYVRINDAARPNFAFRWQLDDAQGNGDGLVQPGEAVRLNVTVTNVGPGEANDVSVAVKNLAGQSLFLDAGRDKLGPLAVGQSKQASLHFRVHGPFGPPEPLPPSAPKGEDGEAEDDEVAPTPLPPVAPKPGDTLGLRLSIWDATLGSPVSEALQFKVASPAAAAQNGAGPCGAHGPNCALRTKRNRTVLYAGASEDAPVLATLRSGAPLTGQKAFARFSQVRLGEQWQGYVRNDDVERTPAARGKPAAAPLAGAVQLAPAIAAPRIVLDARPVLVDDDHVVLTGSVSCASGLKDMFVFVGEKKVYFRYLTGGASQAGVALQSDVAGGAGGTGAKDDKEKEDAGAAEAPSAHFRVPIKLQPGTNSVALFVRSDDDLLTRELFFIHRRKAPGGAVTP